MTGSPNDADPGHLVSRRTVLRSAAALGGLSVLAGCGSGSASRHATVKAWVARRGRTYFIAHRGSGDVYPEHSFPAYRAALGWGAQCMEVSVDMTSDGVLICMHDLTYDRTTTGHGLVATQPSSVLSSIGIRQPQLGPFWVRPPLPVVPRLVDVLREFGGRLVICLEAKNDAAYPPMMALVERLHLQDSIIVKAYKRSPRIREAQQAGYPVFNYLSTGDMTAETIAATAARLRVAHDYLVLPATNGDDLTYYPDELVAGAVSHGVPVWVYPIHRRVDAAHYFRRGVVGAVSSSYGYTSSGSAIATTDSWAGKAIASGEMTRQPNNPRIAPSWTGRNELTLDVHGTQQFVTLGQFCPLASAAGTYWVTFSACWKRLPADLTSNLTLAFGHTDDTYYEHRLGRSDGYHALMRPNGALELYKHSVGNRDGVLLGSLSTPAARAGQWMSFRLDVTPSTITWTRTDIPEPNAVTAHDAFVRGGYLHIGRSARDYQASLSFRNFEVT